MPTYEYACTDCGHRLDAVQKFTDDPLTTCPECGGSLRKVYGAVGIVMKGSGFYKTDSRTSSGAKAGSGSSSASDGSSNGSSTTDGSGSKDASSGNDGSASNGSKDSSGTKDSSGSKDGGGGKPATKAAASTS
jgi:putative FmdB family regulatory protein